MPQLDATTYFTQFVWLFITYASFYIVLTKTILPKIAHILYVRQTKAAGVELAENTSSQSETQKSMQVSTQHMLEACMQSKHALETTVQQSQDWLTQTTAMLHQTQLKPLHAQYTTHVQTSTHAFAHMETTLKHTAPPSAHMQLAHPQNTNKSLVFHQALVRTLFKA